MESHGGPHGMDTSKKLDVPKDESKESLEQEQGLFALYEKLEVESKTLNEVHKNKVKNKKEREDHQMGDSAEVLVESTELQVVDNPDQSEAEVTARVQEIKSMIDNAERLLLGVPVDVNGGVENTVEETISNEEFHELRKDLDETMEAVREEYIKKVTESFVKKYESDFKRAVNGESAEKLFRIKFPFYLRKNLEDPQIYSTHFLLEFKTVIGKDGGSIFYLDYMQVSSHAGENETSYGVNGEAKNKKENLAVHSKRRASLTVGKDIELVESGKLKDVEAPKMRNGDWTASTRY